MGQWKVQHKETLVLSPDTEFKDRYVRPLQIGVFDPYEAVFGDDRLPSNALIVGVEVDGFFKGYPLEELKSAGGVVNDTISDRPVVVVYDSDAQTGVAYLRDVRGQTLEFYNAAKKGFEIRDRETNSMWDVRGRLVQGVHGETKLEFVPSFISEWYGWSA